jgi:hypothetical protein
VTSPLKIEVTEAMREAGVLASNEYWAREIVPCEKCLSTGAFDGDLCPSCGGGGCAANGDEVGAMQAALTAAFQHPEFVRQIREQVMRCVGPDATPTPDGRWAIDAKALVLSVGPEYATGNNAANHFTRASLGRLLGEG